MSYSGVQPQYGTFPSDLFTGNGSNTVFTMSSVPGNDAALLVTVDGVRQHTDTYSFSANTLTFSEAPGSGAIIETVNMGSRADIIITEGVYKKTQFTATAAQTNFNILTGYTVGFVDVYLNGIRLVVADDFTANDGSTIILATAAASGDSVEVVAYGTFNVANALLKSGDTMSGNLVVSGTTTMLSPVAVANTTGNTFVIANTGAVTITGSANISSTLAAGNTTITGDLTSSGDGTFNGGDVIISKAHGSGSYPSLILKNATAGTTYSGRVQFVDGNGNNGWNVGTNITQGTGILEFNDNTTARMYIDSSGRVRMPYQTCFHAQKNNGPQDTVAVITFDSALTNVGSNYSTSTSRFTAPIAGTYHFYASVLDNGAASSHGGPRVALRVNGTNKQMQQNFYNRSDSFYNFIHVELTITLAASDYVDLYNDSGGPIYGSDLKFGYFGGWLIG